MRKFFFDCFGDTVDLTFSSKIFNSPLEVLKEANEVYRWVGVKRVHVFEILEDNTLRSVGRFGYHNHPLDIQG